MIAIMIIMWVLTVIAMALGYYVGRGGTPESAVKEVERVIKRRTGAVGVVTRPPPEKVILWNDKKREQEEEAFKESFTKQTGREHP